MRSQGVAHCFRFFAPSFGFAWAYDALFVSALEPALPGATVRQLATLPSAWAPLAGAVLVLAGALEEFGWRGFAQPRLQERYGATAAAILIGLLWGVWHYPKYRMGYIGDMHFALFTAHIVAMSVLLAWVYNSTKGVLPVMVMHAAHNAPGQIALPVAEVPAGLSASPFP